MTYYLFSGDIEADALKPVFELLNKVGGEITLGIDSPGGDPTVACFLLEILNTLSDRLTLVACGYVMSAAFDVWYKYDGEKRVTPGSLGMVHISYFPSVEVSSTGVPEDIVKAAMPMMKRAKTQDDKWVRGILTTEEFKRYNRGEKIYLDDLRLSKIAKG